jgi:hypothetical protein
MRFKLTSELCYFAGLADRVHSHERSRIEFTTSYDELAEKFVECAIKLGVSTRKMIIEEEDTKKHIYFYHSKLARIIQEVLDQRQFLPKKGKELAASFAAGMFDSSGHSLKGGIYLKNIEKKDELMLELMGVHTQNGYVLNARDFLGIIGGRSFLAKALLTKT